MSRIEANAYYTPCETSLSPMAPTVPAATSPKWASVSTESASVEINTPINRVPTGHLVAAFKARAKPGLGSDCWTR